MIIVKRTEPPHPCMNLLWDFYNTQVDETGLALLGVGSIVECDCGSQYTLSDSQRDGKFWVKVIRPIVAEQPIV